VQIDFLGIQAFLAIAECGSFGQAAARLHLSQTAVSHRMRKLEESLGVQLVVRTSRGIALTQAGSALLPHTRRSVQQLEASCEAVRTHGGHAARWLTFGCVPTVAAAILVPLLERTMQARDGMPVRVFDGTPNEIVELVEARTIPFGITVARPVPDHLAMLPLAREPFVLVCPAGHRFAERGDVAWGELAGEPMIRISLPSGNSMTIDDALGPLREKLQWRYEAQRTAMALEMVRGGLGLTVVPRLAIPRYAGVLGVPLVEPVVSRTLALLQRRDETLEGLDRLLADTAALLVTEGLAVP
jgi:DNA-binding transcriptional LysR family regulator